MSEDKLIYTGKEANAKLDEVTQLANDVTAQKTKLRSENGKETFSVASLTSLKPRRMVEKPLK